MTKTIRPIEIVFVNDKKSYTSVEPSKVVLKFGRNRIDIGAYCFSVRDKRANSRSGVKKVDLDSLCPIRVAVVDLIIKFFFSQRHQAGKSLDTVHAYWAEYKYFFEWCEAQDDFPNLLDATARRNSVQDYCAELHIQYRLNPMATNKYSNRQKAAIGFTSIIFSDELVGQGIPKIYFNSNINSPTEAPEEEAQAKSYAMCQAVYVGFSNFFKKNLRYPFRWELPAYLGGAIWVFPCLVKFMSPFNNYRQILRRSSRAYNFEQGVLRSLSELAVIYKNSDTAYACRKLAVKTLSDANADPRHFRRIELANHAITAFMSIFQANTGMNLTQVTSLPWKGGFEVEKADQGFRVVKWRAGGVVIKFRTTMAFIALFKEFLEFRSILLQDRVSATLFFHLHSKRGVYSIDSGIQHRFEEFLRKVDSNFKLLRTRQWRSAKSDSVIQRNSISTTADSLQNTSSTVRIHYIEGRESDQKRQFKSFFEALSKVVILIGSGLKDIALAKCESPGTPLKDGNGEIVPDCKSEVGCLFCKFFRVHADEIGIRKLLSCHYFVQRISYSNPSDQFQNEIYLPALNRIEEILKYISSISGEMNELVNRVRSSVYDDYELDNYWADRIESLVQVGYL